MPKLVIRLEAIDNHIAVNGKPLLNRTFLVKKNGEWNPLVQLEDVKKNLSKFSGIKGDKLTGCAYVKRVNLNGHSLLRISTTGEVEEFAISHRIGQYLVTGAIMFYQDLLSKSVYYTLDGADPQILLKLSANVSEILYVHHLKSILVIIHYPLSTIGLKFDIYTKATVQLFELGGKAWSFQLSPNEKRVSWLIQKSHIESISLGVASLADGVLLDTIYMPKGPKEVLVDGGEWQSDEVLIYCMASTHSTHVIQYFLDRNHIQRHIIRNCDNNYPAVPCRMIYTMKDKSVLIKLQRHSKYVLYRLQLNPTMISPISINHPMLNEIQVLSNHLLLLISSSYNSCKRGFTLNTITGDERTLFKEYSHQLPSDYFTKYEDIFFTSHTGHIANIIYYPPMNPFFIGDSKIIPPCILNINYASKNDHDSQIQWNIQYSTSRGYSYAIVDCNRPGMGSPQNPTVDFIDHVSVIPEAVSHLCKIGKANPSTLYVDKMFSCNTFESITKSNLLPIKYPFTTSNSVNVKNGKKFLQMISVLNQIGIGIDDASASARFFNDMERFLYRYVKYLSDGAIPQSNVLIEYGSLHESNLSSNSSMFSKLAVLKIAVDANRELLHVPIKDGCNAVDIPLYVMDSFDGQVVRGCKIHEGLRNQHFLQSRFPFFGVKSSLPPKNCTYESEQYWYGAGLYESLIASGILDELISGGKEYLFVSDIRNVGATVDESIVEYLNRNQSDFLHEVIELNNSKKVAASNDMLFAKNGKLHVFNNFDINSALLKRMRDEQDTIRQLTKTIAPSDGELQIKFFESPWADVMCNASDPIAIVVKKTRAVYLQSTSDLFTIKSELYCISNGVVGLNPKRNRNEIPVVKLGEEFTDYDFEGLTDFKLSKRKLKTLDYIPITFEEDQNESSANQSNNGDDKNETDFVIARIANHHVLKSKADNNRPRTALKKSHSRPNTGTKKIVRMAPVKSEKQLPSYDFVVEGSVSGLSRPGTALSNSTKREPSRPPTRVSDVLYDIRDGSEDQIAESTLRPNSANTIQKLLHRQLEIERTHSVVSRPNSSSIKFNSRATTAYDRIASARNNAINSLKLPPVSSINNTDELIIVNHKAAIRRLLSETIQKSYFQQQERFFVPISERESIDMIKNNSITPCPSVSNGENHQIDLSVQKSRSRSFNIINGEIAKPADSFYLFQEFANMKFESTLIKYFLGKLEQFSRKYNLTWAECSFEKIYSILENPVDLLFLKESSLIDAMINKDEVEMCCKNKAQLFKGKTAMITAATAIQSAWRMYICKVEYRRWKKMLLSAGKFRDYFRLLLERRKRRNSWNCKVMKAHEIAENLNYQFRADWKSNFHDRDRVIVMVNSMSFPYKIRNNMNNISEVEMEQFGRLVALFDTKVSVVFITHELPVQVRRYLIYLINLNLNYEELINSKRLVIIELAKPDCFPSKASLTSLLLASTAVLPLIKFYTDGLPSYIAPIVYGKEEIILSSVKIYCLTIQSLNIPIFGSQSAFSEFSHRYSNQRRFAIECGTEVPPGIEFYAAGVEVQRCNFLRDRLFYSHISKLLKQNREIKRWIFKIHDIPQKQGLAYFCIDDLPSILEHDLTSHLKLKMHYVTNTWNNWDDYLYQLECNGGVLEAMPPVPFQEVHYPSIYIEIYPNCPPTIYGSSSKLSTSEFEHSGSITPSKFPELYMIKPTCRQLAQSLAENNYIGMFCIEYVSWKTMDMENYCNWLIGIKPYFSRSFSQMELAKFASRVVKYHNEDLTHTQHPDQEYALKYAQKAKGCGLQSPIFSNQDELPSRIILVIQNSLQSELAALTIPFLNDQSNAVVKLDQLFATSASVEAIQTAILQFSTKTIQLLNMDLPSDILHLDPLYGKEKAIKKRPTQNRILAGMSPEKYLEAIEKMEQAPVVSTGQRSDRRSSVLKAEKQSMLLKGRKYSFNNKH
ncbi:UTP-glucose-1-phosphate uridylyltransferase [Globomyces sp. JEL0801]|nr:UTP-glucose-1-phosphate uridylyltransferase [Globomyces sp. JEL0801]